MYGCKDKQRACHAAYISASRPTVRARTLRWRLCALASRATTQFRTQIINTRAPRVTKPCLKLLRVVWQVSDYI